MSNISPQMVETVKRIVIQKCNQQSNKYDPADVDRIGETDEMICRHIYDYQINNPRYEKNFDSAAAKIADCVLYTLAWRKEIAVNSMKDSDFPLEFYSLDLFRRTRGRNGRLVLVFNYGRIQRLSAWSSVWINFIVHECEKMTQEYLHEANYLESEKPLVFCDSSEIGLAHMDFKFILKIINVFLHHFTQAFGCIWLYELPMFSLTLRPVLNASLPKKITRLVFFTDSANVCKDIGDDNVPAEYGGKIAHPLQSLTPKNASSIREVGKKLAIDESEISKMQESCRVKLTSIGK